MTASLCPAKATLSIIIPVFNQFEVTSSCVSSLLLYQPCVPFEIIVVDDASSVNSTDFLKELTSRDPRIRTLRNDTNQGFARSCNHGAREAKGSYLLFLNSDTEVQPGWFTPLFTCLEDNPDVGIAGPKLIFPDGTIQHCGKVWKETEGPLSQPHHIYYRAPADMPCVNKSRNFRCLTAACIMVRRNEFLSIGPFDESYENGWEDDDLCYSYTSAGMHCRYCAESTVIHHESMSLNEKITDNDRRLSELRRSHSGQERDRAETVQELGIMAELEQQLLKVRDRFRRNRERFLSKWRDSISRDDYKYYLQDGFPFASIIIPVFNNVGYTAKCLAALENNTPQGSYELIIIDNGSTDGTGDFLRESAKGARIITNRENLGFARACNQGAEAAIGEYMLFLNNDTEPLTGWLDAMLEVIHADPSIGAVGSRLLYPDGTIQHAGVILADDRSLSDPLVARHIHAGRPGSLPEANIRYRYQALTAASLMVRRTAFREAGGFDEGYWNGYEDVDLCLNLGAKGHCLVYVPTSVVVHHESKSGPERFARAGDNIRRLHEKWLGRISPDVIISNNGSTIEKDNGIVGPYSGPGALPETAEPGNPLVSIVILTFNQLDCTKECIDSIRSRTPESHEIIFVDNGSTDGTREWLRSMAAGNKNYHIIENLENKGFAAGCNQGIHAANGKFILLLNNDVIVTDGWLAGLLDCHRSVPKTGIVGPMTNNISGIQQVPVVPYSDLSGLDSYAAAFRARYQHRRIPHRRIVGFCMLFKKSLTDEIGLLDESFGSGNFEDDDLCLRAELAGYRNMIAGDVFIHHVGSASFRGNGIDYDSAMMGNGRLFREKWSRPVSDERLGKQIVRLKCLERAEHQFFKDDEDAMIDTLLQDGIKANSAEVDFYFQLAEYLIDLERYQDALDTLKEAPVQSADERMHLLTGWALAGLGCIDDAVRHGKDALETNPRSTKAIHLLGMIAASRRNTAEAEEHWRRALVADPGYGPPYTSLGQHLVVDQPEEGYSLLEKGFLLSPLSRDTARGLHAAACSQGKFERAAELFGETHRFYPNHRMLHFLYIDILIRQGKITAALEQIEEACLLFGVERGMIEAGLELRRQIGPLSIQHETREAGTAVSLCMIVKNEEKNLARCLQSLKPVVDEMIVVDTGSTDLTREIAEMFGAHVFNHPWNGDFSAARNVSLNHAAGNWILVMDADETLSARDHEQFRRAIAAAADGNEAAFDIVTRNYALKSSLEKWRENDGAYPENEAGAGWTPSNKVRLFPNRKAIRFQNPIHEMVDKTIVAAGIVIKQLPIPVHHYGNLDEDRLKKKGEDYYQLGKKKLSESGTNDFRALCELAVQAGAIERYNEAEDLWRRVLAIDPAYPLAHFNLGYCLLQLGRFEESKAASIRALELQPDYCEAAINFALSELCSGDAAIAIDKLEGILETKPSYPNARVMLAVALLYSGKHIQGTEAMKRLSEEGVVFTEFINDCIRKFRLSGKLERIEPLLESALASGNYNEETLRLAKQLLNEMAVA